jgi:hypothetical protein
MKFKSKSQQSTPLYTFGFVNSKGQLLIVTCFNKLMNQLEPLNAVTRMWNYPTTVEILWQFPKWLGIELLFAQHSYTRYTLSRNENMYTKYTYRDVYSSILHNGQSMGKIQMSINWLIDKDRCGLPMSAMLFSYKSWSFDT